MNQLQIREQDARALVGSKMSQISTKEQIIKFKDYADIADASYAMLHWVS